MIKRILLLLAFLCLATTVRAATINVQSATVSGFNGSTSATYQLWAFSDSAWTDVSGNPHGAGSPSDKVFTQIVTGLSYNNSTKVLTIPAFTLTSTTDALVNPNVRLYLWIFQVVGASATPVKPYPNTENGIKVPPTIASAFSCSSGTPPTCASLYDLIVYTQGAQPAPSPRFTYTDAQIDAKIVTASGGIPTSRSISVTAPLTGGGDLSANRTVGITKATGSVDGYLAAADFTIFTAKITDPLTTRGDILVRNSSNVGARLAAGGSGTYLRSNGTDPGWSSIQAGDVPSLSATYVDLSSIQASIAGAKTFTTSVSGPLFDKGGAIFNARAYSVTCDGSTDNATAINNTVTTAATTGGGVVYLMSSTGDCNVNSSINIGNGTSTTVSTYNAVRLVGAGSTYSNFSGARPAVRLKWGGTALGGPVISINGPMGGVTIENLVVDGNSTNTAGTLIKVMHAEGTIIRGVALENCASVCLDVDSYGVASFNSGTIFTGSYGNNGYVENLIINNPVASSTLIRLGATGTVSQWQFIGGRINAGNAGSTTGIQLSHTDHNFFYGLTVGGVDYGVRYKPLAGVPGLPGGNFFYACPLIGNVAPTVVDNTFATYNPASDPNVFIGYPQGDSEPVPTDIGSIGFTSRMQHFGVASFRDAVSFGGTSAGEIRLYEPSGTGTIYSGFVGPASISSNLVYRLPSAPPTAGQILQAAAPSGGVAVTSWVNSTSSVGGADTFVQFNSVGTFQGSANFTWSNVNATLLLGGAAASGDSRERLHTQATSAGGVIPQIVVDDFSGAAGNNSFPFIAGRGARNTSASPAAVQNGDYLLGIVGKGYNGSGYSGNAALISLRAKETFGGSANGSYITLETTPAGSTTRRESLRIENDGSLTNLLTDAQTNAVTTAGTFNHQSTGTAANGYGSRYLFQLQDDGGTMQNAAAIDVTWVSAVSGSRNASLTFSTAATGGILASSLALNASGAGVFTRTLAASPSGQNGAFNLRVSGFTPANGDGARMLISGPDSIGTFNNWGSYGGGCEDCTNGSGHQKGYLSIFVKTGDTDTFTNSREASRWTSAGIFNTYKGADVASATTITATGNLFHVTGTTTITGIATTSIQAGTCLNIIFDGVLQLTNSSTFKIAGSANYTTTAGTAMIWCTDGTAWQEFARAQR